MESESVESTSITNRGAGVQVENEKDPSLCEVLFKMDVRRSEEETNKIVKAAIKSAICSRVLSLKEEISEEMNLKETEEILRKQVEELKINRKVLLSMKDKPLVLEKGDEKIKKSKETIKCRVREIMENITEIEKRIHKLQLCWGYFTANYKDHVYKMINLHIEMQKKKKNEEAVQWTDFLPVLSSTNQSGGKPINYYD